MQIESITPKQTEILLLLYRYRFLNSLHIQKFLDHKSHTLINHWLTDLTKRNIIQKIDVKKSGVITSKPSIYYLGLKSRSILKQNEKCHPDLLDRVYQEKRRSETFRNHCLALSDFYFHFQLAAQKLKASLSFYTSTEVSDFAYAPLPVPDAYIVIEEKDQISRYFLEIIDGSEKWFVIDRRMRQYISYFKKKYWQDHVKLPFPSILLICPNTKLQNHLRILISNELESEKAEIDFFTGIYADIQERGIQMDTWQII
jgi:hypothetical protein